MSLIIVAASLMYLVVICRKVWHRRLSNNDLSNCNRRYIIIEIWITILFGMWLLIHFPILQFQWNRHRRIIKEISHHTFRYCIHRECTWNDSYCGRRKAVYKVVILHYELHIILDLKRNTCTCTCISRFKFQENKHRRIIMKLYITNYNDTADNY